MPPRAYVARVQALRRNSDWLADRVRLNTGMRSIVQLCGCKSSIQNAFLIKGASKNVHADQSHIDTTLEHLSIMRPGH